jgi:hypothetical protein
VSDRNWGVSSNGTKSGAKLETIGIKAFAEAVAPRTANDATSGIYQYRVVREMPKSLDA